LWKGKELGFWRRKRDGPREWETSFSFTDCKHQLGLKYWTNDAFTFHELNMHNELESLSIRGANGYTDRTWHLSYLCLFPNPVSGYGSLQKICIHIHNVSTTGTDLDWMGISVSICAPKSHNNYSGGPIIQSIYIIILIHYYCIPSPWLVLVPTPWATPIWSYGWVSYKIMMGRVIR